jgi:protein-disulfide isomerase
MRQLTKVFGVGFLFFSLCGVVGAKAPQKTEGVFIVNGKTYTQKDVAKRDPGGSYDLKEKEFRFLNKIAREVYLESFWEQEGKKRKVSAEKAKEVYLKEKVRVSAAEVKATLEKYKTHPQLSRLPKKEQEKQIRDYLEQERSALVYETIIQAAITKGQLTVLVDKPKEPVFDVAIKPTDFVRYGPALADNKPLKCKGNNCKYKVIEYSEFQCPYCAKTLPGVDAILEKYKGDIAWVVRSYPLPFHKRAEPAGLASLCAGFQGKFYKMYDVLFKNQRKLEDNDLEAHAKTAGLNVAEFKKCMVGERASQLLTQQKKSGEKFKVSGTPHFFINGKRHSGLITLSTFERIAEVNAKPAAKTAKKETPTKKAM